MRLLAVALLVLGAILAFLIFAPGSSRKDQALARNKLEALLVEAREMNEKIRQGTGDTAENFAKKAELDNKLRNCGYVPSRFEFYHARATFSLLTSKMDALLRDPSKTGPTATNRDEANATTLEMLVQHDRLKAYRAAISE